MKLHAILRLAPAALALAASVTLPAHAANDAPEMAAPPAPRVIISTDLNGSDLAFFAGANQAGARLLALCQLGSKRASLPEVRNLATAISKSQVEDQAGLQKLADQVAYGLQPVKVNPASLGGLDTADGPRADKLFLDQLAAALDTLTQSLQAGSTSHRPAIATYSKTALAKATAVRTALRQMGM